MSDKTLGPFTADYLCLVFVRFVLVAASNEIVFINFYADWCRFSKILQPIFDEAADVVMPSIFPFV